MFACLVEEPNNAVMPQKLDMLNPMKDKFHGFMLYIKTNFIFTNPVIETASE